MSIRAFLPRFWRNRKGISSIEFTIIVFPMLIIFFGMIQFGSLFYYYNQMQNAARDAARRMAVDDDILPINPAAEAAIACSTTPAAGSAEAYACGLLRVPAEVSVTACHRGDPVDTERFDAEVVLTAPMDDVALVDLLGIMEGKTLTASAIMRVEPGKLDENSPVCS